MSKFIRVFTSLLLAVLLALTVPLQTFAAEKELYISEIAIETGRTAEEAKRKLESAGYIVFDCNISNCKSGSNTFGYMYIGYKTTTDPDEAITDIRLMHMDGGYSYAEYEQIIDQKKDELGMLIEQLCVAVGEFRANYAAGREAAAVAYGILNQLKEDDTGLLMGDYLLDPSKTAGDYLNVFLQCSTVVFVTVENALAIACSATNEQNIYALAELDPEDFQGEVQYEAVAGDLYKELPHVQSVLSVYEKSGLTTADGASEDDIAAAVSVLTDEEKYDWSRAFSFAYALESVELCDGSTLYDLLMTDTDEITTEDLYPLASVLSDGQAALVRTVGLQNVLSAAVMKEDMWTEADTYSYKADGPISIYTGVDRSIFEGGVALTSRAMVEAAANTEKNSWLDSLAPETEEVFSTIYALVAYTMIGVGVTFMGAFTFQGIFSSVASALYVSSLASKAAAAAVSCCNAIIEMCGYAYVFASYAAILAIGVVLIAGAVYLIASGYRYKHPIYDEMPRILVEKDTDEKDETVYTYYYAIKNSGGEVVDINQHDASRWVCLYTTKDRQAGEPIADDMIVVRGTSMADSGFIGVRKFSQDAAFDLNKFSYNLNDTVNRDGEQAKIRSTYLFFMYAQEKRNNYASVFSGETTLIGVCSLVLGLAVGAAGMLAVSKKKRKDVPNSGTDTVSV